MKPIDTMREPSPLFQESADQLEFDAGRLENEGRFEDAEQLYTKARRLRGPGLERFEKVVVVAGMILVGLIVFRLVIFCVSTLFGL